MREISDKEYQEITDTFSIKSEYEKSSGKDVTPERFLFCCYEVGKHLKEVDIHFKDKNLWPPLSDESFKPAEDELSTQIRSLIDWYKAEQKHLSDTRPVDFDSMWHVCVELAHLEKDLGDLVRLATGTDLEDHLLDEDALEEPWGSVKSSLTEVFPSIGEKTWRYYMWAYGITPPKEEVNLSEVPPVGRFARAIVNGRRRGGNDRPGQGRGHGRGQERGQGNKRGNRNSRGNESRGNSGHMDRGHKNGGKKGGGKGFRKNGAPSGHDKAKEQEVIALVEAAVSSKLSGNEHVTLAPQNSFFRRIQHKHAVSMGYSTESIGEGKERAVRIFAK